MVDAFIYLFEKPLNMTNNIKAEISSSKKNCFGNLVEKLHDSKN